MDTRSKIVAFDDALAQARGRRAAIVTGYFDPLTAAHVTRLREIRGSDHDALIVLLSEPAQPILGALASAELVAALEMVDFVVLGGEPDVERHPEFPVYREEQADEARFEQLVDRVHRRHNERSARRP